MATNLESGFNTTLALPLAPADTTMTVATVPTKTSGRVYLNNGEQEERISYTGISGSTLTGLTRNLSQTADPATGGTGLTWIAGTEVILVVMHDQLVDKTASNTYATGTVQTFPDIDFTGTTTQGLRVKNVTTAQRTSMTPSNGAIVYDSTIGELYQYIGGAWSAISAGSTQPNASTTVAGKVEIATSAEAVGGATTGGTGATVVADPATTLIVGAYFEGINTLYNCTISASRAGSAETISLLTKAGTAPSATDPILVGFRNVTAGTGDFTYLTLTSSTTITIPSTATMGASNSVPFRLWLVGFNDGGTFRLGVVNTQTAGGVMALDDDMLLSSTIINTSSDNAGVIYTGTAVSSKAMKLIGYLDYTLATVGTRGTAPSKIQLFGSGVKKPGDIVQVAYTSSSGFTDITAVVPYDDTIPQVGEGTEVFSISLTQTANANKVLVDSVITGAIGSSQNLIASIYQNAGADAVMTVDNTTVSSGNMNALPISYMGIAGTTSPTVLSLRVGVGSASTFTLNGAAGARKFGTVAKSYMKVTEIMV